jgi:glycosyltransferase involved in cell wall biosynthesis
MSAELRHLLIAVVATILIAAVVRTMRRLRLPGVNVVGYFRAAAGLGERARELADCLEAAGVPVTRWDVTFGGRRRWLVRRHTIAMITAIQLEPVRQRCPQPFNRVRRTVGYFFWEVPDVPAEQQWGIGLVDEIWAPTEFVRAAYAAATDRPVRLVPLPIADPGPYEAGRRPDGPFTFLVSFDHRSVMERKNPIGAIEAFRRAFPDRGDVRLVVKTMNAADQPAAAARLAAAADGDERILLWDECLERDAHVALLAGADALVSLHRSEGLGLHLAEAMWLGVPVVATRYSGNLDLMDDRCAALVDCSVIPVVGGGEAYPEPSVWADPDPDDAARIMRRLVDDDVWRDGLAERARARIEHQPTRAEVGAAIAELLGISTG